MQTQMQTADGHVNVLAAHALSMRFTSGAGQPVAALSELSLTVRQAAITGLVGPDGAGKTTLLRIATGLLRPASGRMTVLGLDAATQSAAIRTRIGYMPQQFGLYEDLTVQENLDLYADLQGIAASERAGRYQRLMHMTGLGPFTDRLAGRLSGGMKQKLGLSCCLVKTPELLILDEPTVGVDPVSRRDLWNILFELVNEDGIGVVVSTAYLDEAENCDHVIVLDDGRMLDQGPPDHFHERVQKRVYRVTPAPGLEPREAQAALQQRPEVIDASIRSGLIRIVISHDAAGRGLELPDSLCAAMESAEPVFEDAFIDLLYDKSGGHALPQGAACSGADSPAAGYADEIVVSVRQLTRRFGDFTAVSGIDFEVSRGEVFGLLGANGAGKSTTFRMLCGLLAASDGEISVAGQDLRRSAAHARSRLGYMAQKFSLYQQLSVRHNLLFYGQAYGLSGQRLRDRVDWALDEFDLESRQGLPAGSLPGGYRQRLAMASAMLHEPDILFLDEPTSSADPLARREFWIRINGFARAGVTVIVTTHFMEEAEFCDHLLIMAQGTTLAQGTPTEIRRLARSGENPEPSVEDAFIALAEGNIQPARAAGQYV